MRTKIYTSLAVCLILLAGCQPKKAAVESVITVPFEPANAIDIGQFIERVHYVQLENHPESAFTDIDKMIVNGENMFMLDKRLEAVFCFDTTGKFRYRIQRVGRGPGEYQELDAMWVKPAEKELWLQSFWPSKIMVYNFDGQMLREFGVRWSARDMVRVGDDMIAGYNASRSNDGVDSLEEGIFLLGEDGKSRGQAKVLGDSSMYWSVAYQRNLEEFGNGALLLSQSDTIFKINQKGEVSPDVFLDWGKLKYPEDLFGISYNSPRYGEAVQGKYVSGKDQLLAFGPIRLFRVFLDSHMELAMADLNTRKGVFSTQITSSVAKVPLLYPIAKSDQDELIGIYDMSLLMAIKESQANRKEDPKTQEFYHEMDSLVESALTQDRPVLWFAKIKQEWLTKSY
ncbi:MAG: 6-bladed beta-propeller [Porphyromonadaceae bacterium]|nr:MAG: 6-bladed beta-propeller [Porphyromonadaceae bacterium]